MPRRADIHKILLLGSGPIVIGQACEFDYSGTQACKVLMEEGYEVVLVNSNPATIMTDPAFAHRTYIEPLVPEVVEFTLIFHCVTLMRPSTGKPSISSMCCYLRTVATPSNWRGVGRRYRMPSEGALRPAW